MPEIKNKEKKHIDRSIRIPMKEYNKAKNIAYDKGLKVSEVLREAMIKGLNVDEYNSNVDLLKENIRECLYEILRPSVERLASIEGKTQLISAINYGVLLEVLSLLTDGSLDITLTTENIRKATSALLGKRTMNNFDSIIESTDSVHTEVAKAIYGNID